MITVTDHEGQDVAHPKASTMTIDMGHLCLHDSSGSTVAIYAPGRWNDAVDGESHFEPGLLVDLADLLSTARKTGEPVDLRFDVNEDGVAMEPVPPRAGLPVHIAQGIGSEIEFALADMREHGGTGRTVNIVLLVDNEGVVAMQGNPE